MKLFRFIGALILSAAPVRAFIAFEEATKSCEASARMGNACYGNGIYFSALTTYMLLCALSEDGLMTREAFAEASRGMEDAN